MKSITRSAVRAFGASVLIAVTVITIGAVILLISSKLLAYSPDMAKAARCAVNVGDDCVSIRMEELRQKNDALEETQGKLRSLESRFANFVLFAEVPLPDTSYKVETGVRYVSIVSGSWSEAWCYIQLTVDQGVDRKLTIAKRSAGGPARAADITDHTLQSAGLSTQQFNRAVSLCQWPDKN
jgi:hypothetical protein